jgi:hypothetical protein
LTPAAPTASATPAAAATATLLGEYTIHAGNAVGGILSG